MDTMHQFYVQIPKDPKDLLDLYPNGDLQLAEHEYVPTLLTFRTQMVLCGRVSPPLSLLGVWE